MLYIERFPFGGEILYAFASNKSGACHLECSMPSTLYVEVSFSLKFIVIKKRFVV